MSQTSILSRYRRCCRPPHAKGPFGSLFEGSWDHGAIVITEISGSRDPWHTEGVGVYGRLERWILDHWNGGIGMVEYNGPKWGARARLRGSI